LEAGIRSPISLPLRNNTAGLDFRIELARASF
jgi:hypothetical protein